MALRIPMVTREGGFCKPSPAFQCRKRRRMAAVALRTLGNRGVGLDAIREAMRSPSERVRWGATRIFAYHSREMAANPAIAGALIHLAGDPTPMVRMGALQALWQWYYWTE